MENKLRSLFPFLLFLFLLMQQLSIVSAQQFTVKLIPPPANQLKQTDLWKLEILNPNRAVAYRVLVFVDLKERTTGIQAESKSSLVDISSGSKRLSFNDFSSWGINYRNPKLQEAFGKNQSAPDGNYTMCVYVKNEKSVELARDCIEISIVSPKLEKVNPQLISPANKSMLATKQPVVFTWMLPSIRAAKEIIYKIKVVEVLPNQSPEEAIKRNPAWFEKDEIRGTTLNYPVSAQKLKPGTTYAWQVSCGEGKSDVFKFMNNDIDIQIDNVSVSCCQNGIHTFTITIKNNLSTTVKITQITIDRVNGVSNSPAITGLSPVLPRNITGNGSQAFTGNTTCINNVQSVRFLVAAQDAIDNAITETEVETDTLNCLCTYCENKPIQIVFGAGNFISGGIDYDELKLPAYLTYVNGSLPVDRIVAELVYFREYFNDNACRTCNNNSYAQGQFVNKPENRVLTNPTQWDNNGIATFYPPSNNFSREATWKNTTPVPINNFNIVHRIGIPKLNLPSCCCQTIKLSIRYSFFSTDTLTTENDSTIVDCRVCDQLVNYCIQRGSCILNECPPVLNPHDPQIHSTTKKRK